VIAIEPVSGEPGWDEIASGELIHVGPLLEVDRQGIVAGSPEHPMVPRDLMAKARPFA
jgi:glutamine amidotransferase